MRMNKKKLALGLITGTLMGVAFTQASSAAIESKVLSYAMQNEPPQLNGMKATDTDSFFILGHIMEGLTRQAKDGKVIPGVAEKWELNDKGATFHLRKNAKWSDGKPVTAKDFVFAWRKTLEPSTASEYAFILYPIKNAEAINSKKMPASSLGVTAVDDYTLKIVFEKPCGYFMSLTYFATYFPVREDFYNTVGEKYGADASTMLYNGPFKLTKWAHQASLTLAKNENYWNKKDIALDSIEIPYITPDDSARFNLFKDKKVDILTPIGKDALPEAQKEGYKLKRFSDGSVFFLEFNFRDGRLTKNLNLRKAVQAVFTPGEYIDKVVSIPGTLAGKTLIPAWVTGKKDLFRKEYPYNPPKPSVAAAKKYMEAAMKELKLTTPPTLVWLTGDTPLAGREAEYFQSVFKNTLGIDIRIDKQTFKQRLEKMLSGDFDIVSAGWGPDYADPMTFADLKASWNENNRGKYENPKYDELIRKAQSTTNSKIRMDAMAAAEKIGLDDLAILPLYERSVVYTTTDKVKGVVRRAAGFDPDFTFVQMSP